MTTGNVATVLTPSGAGAIAVVRIAGPEALHVIEQFFESASSAASMGLAPNRLHYGRFRVDGEIVDDVIVSQFVLDGVPVVDVSMHGGVRIVERVLQALEDKGVRFEDAGSVPSWKAENKIELEILDAVGRAKTGRAVRFLSMQRRRLVCEIHRVASLIRANPVAARDALQGLLSGCTAARRLIEGVSIALVGPPNSGKSTLFNALVGRGAAVVSQQAGTTRDWVEASVAMDGLSVRLIDSAGIREPADDLERQAIEAGRLKVSDADLRILIFDGTEQARYGACDMLKPFDAPLIVALNKSDVDGFGSARVTSRLNAWGTETIHLSARMGTGIDSLRGCVRRMMGLESFDDRRPTLFTERQQSISSSVLSDLQTTGVGVERVLTYDLIRG